MINIGWKAQPHGQEFLGILLIISFFTLFNKSSKDSPLFLLFDFPLVAKGV